MKHRVGKPIEWKKIIDETSKQGRIKWDEMSGENLSGELIK